MTANTTTNTTITRSAALLAYESSPQFHSYLAARAVWNTAHDNYMAGKSDATFTALRQAHDAMHKALTVCRTTEEHLVAFGW